MEPSLVDYDPLAVAGTAACIEQPESDYDQALRDIYDWYVFWYKRSLEPPLPQALLKRFMELAESAEDYQEAVEITIVLAYRACHGDGNRGYALGRIIRMAGLLGRFVS